MKVGEQVSVVASFGMPYKLRPVRFRWAGKLLEVRDVTYTWQSSEGQSRLHHFAVTDGTDAYELSFNATSLVWQIEALDTGGAAEGGRR